MGIAVLLVLAYLTECFGIVEKPNLISCPTGTYGYECQYNCSEFCKSYICNISVSTAVPKCNTGCNNHRTGIFCQELCPNLCLECNQTDGSCFKCTNGYYGPKCEEKCNPYCMNGICESDGTCVMSGEGRKRETRSSEGRCEEPDTNGNCKCCRTPYRGNTCETSCDNCQTVYVPNKACRYQCATGLFGYMCQYSCPTTCAVGNSGKPLCGQGTSGGKMKCLNGCLRGFTGLQCDRNCTGNCKNGTCHQTNGNCIKCNDGKYGDMCTKICSKGCAVGSCERDGSCKTGCVKGFYGKDCSNVCPENCLYCNTTGTEIPTCFECSPGFHGTLCTKMCSKRCKKNVCIQNDGTCNSGCKIGYFGDKCQEQCGRNCKNSRCEQHIDNGITTFLCLGGCIDGYKGRHCNQQCSKHCAICGQMSAENDCIVCMHEYTRKEDAKNHHMCLSSNPVNTAEVSEADDSKMPIWGWVVIGVGVLFGTIICIVIVILLRKKRDSSQNKRTTFKDFKITGNKNVYVGDTINTRRETIDEKTPMNRNLVD